ncbi:2-octaprenylphenol hydroxylase [Thermoanaerobacter thermohydrosulfuricus]|uniref:Predicted unusual protein kinase n=3 Tax=Thermoanaerobacteraceae TaxID=186814 RepID=Q8R8Z2_CALS4|nr:MULTISPECIES: 2-polyprenylphenol 6-hydroxylase [Thermoanaerobacteraceae]AAM25031.1 predicted unusual protein kinase [Caldanaerobacter subterraneus subsp. tengcongensis MB4]EMT38720.1 2-polyprenylphenol 6-hydroxylase [Thermoanaerobacter thermohydrosulfuricus WC1]MCS3915385.1 ubiquinone biosynthesis protein [Caldanaerobacter subterraneus subsp. tengcongensis MB4]SDF85207.1 2-octaprenylphenol hydroxylase [Thermoanaerobacter thermohydrosulfuricus]
MQHLRRYREIIFVFIKYGFGAIIDNIGILKHINVRRKILKQTNDENIAKLSRGERLRLALEELGPTFIKMGQILSTRSDILPKDIIKELEKLQDKAPAFSFDEVKSVIQNEFGESLEEAYAEFEPTPLAAASIAQVHKALLWSGKTVVVKVQRPGIEKIIAQDMRILEDIAKFVDNHTKYGKIYNFTKMVEDFKKRLEEELDFRIEGENAEKFKKNFLKDKKVKIPSIIWTHTTRRVLTMEYIGGIPLNDFNAIDEAGLDRGAIARNLAKSVLNQILRDGFFHGDPHPGNIMVLEDGTIAFLDFGMVGSLSPERKRQFSKMLLGIVYKNSRMIIESIIDLNAVTLNVNMKKLEKDINNLRDRYVEIPLEKLKVGEVLNGIFDLVFSYNIVIPNEFNMLAKSLITLEGIVEKLDPKISVLEVAKPIAKQLIPKMFSTQHMKEEIINATMDYSRLIKELPSFLLNFLRKTEEENYAIELKIRDLENLEKRVDKVFNRLSTSIILLALSIVIAGILIGSGMSANAGAEMYKLNGIILKIGLAIAFVIVLGLAISIFRSGRL